MLVEIGRSGLKLIFFFFCWSG